MSSPPSDNEKGATAASTPSVTAAQLKALTEGMHALAQPLSIARATLELALLRSKTIEELRHAMENSIVEIDRGGNLLSYIHELARIYQDSGPTERVDISSLLNVADEDLRRVFEDAQIALFIQQGDKNSFVLGSANRIRQVLFYVLQAAQSVSSAGDIVSVTLTKNSTIVEINIASSCKQVRDNLPASVARSLTLAEAIVVSLRGCFACTAVPFSVSIKLRSAES